VIRLIIIASLAMGALVMGQLQKLHPCTLIETAWADGDSFSVRLPDGKQQTIRLYGVDCIEMHVQGDDSNARRLRDQRRHFGIADILIAKSVGESAKAETFRRLAKPFTIHTAFADGRGDGRFSRVYAFVETADGKDLAEELVTLGLARAYGVVRQRPDATPGPEWMEQLKDLELTAARGGLGAWAHTDWASLPAARKQARDELSEIEAAKGRRDVTEDQPLDLNSAARDELMNLPGIGEKTANEIIGNRPFTSVDDITRVPGIGPATLEKLRPLVIVKKR
jgi:competence ComEA-like helix-hairpin-helix protein